jgi:hypothetical protein
MGVLIQLLLSTSVVIAGVWLADYSIPSKMIILGFLAFMVSFTQAQLMEILRLQLDEITQIKIYLRVFEKSYEHGNKDPDIHRSARGSVLDEIKNERAVLEFKEKISPDWFIQIFTMALGFGTSVLVAWIWVTLYRHLI